MSNSLEVVPYAHAQSIYQVDTAFFAFEEDFVEDNIRCIPMIVRFKLDACGIKLQLQQWSKLNQPEREALSFTPCATTAQLTHYRQLLAAFITSHQCGPLVTLPVNNNPAWADIHALPQELVTKLDELHLYLPLQAWKELSRLQRFALLKLCRPGHENRNFPLAFKEFGLA